MLVTECKDTEQPVVKSLVDLFQDLQEAQAGWQPGQARRVVNPTPLREALSEMTHCSFRVGEMNDANELLDTIYDCIALADPSTASGTVRGTRGQIVDNSFGLMVSEAVQCGQCGKVTHQVGEHYEHMLVVSAASLQLCNMCTDTSSFGELLRTVQEQEKKTCDKDVGGCGMEQTPLRVLEESPQIVALQLSWDMDVQGSDIGATLGAVQEILHLPALYPAVDPGVKNRTFRLQSMVAYYGQHYMALVYNHEVSAWLLFDDASISQVGQWADVVKKCQAGRIQPSVLFYLEDATAAKGGDAGAAATSSSRGLAFEQQQPVQQQQQPKQQPRQASPKQPDAQPQQQSEQQQEQ